MKNYEAASFERLNDAFERVLGFLSFLSGSVLITCERVSSEYFGSNSMNTLFELTLTPKST